MIQSIKSSNFKQASADQKTMQQVLQGLFAQTTKFFQLSFFFKMHFPLQREILIFVCYTERHLGS